MSSLYKQSKSAENKSNQTQPKRSIYMNSNRSTRNDNSQSTMSNSNENSSIEEQKTFRYIKYLKDQNVQLKQQLDKERQASPLQGGFEAPMARMNDQFNQIQVHQFQVQLAALQNEFIRYKNQNEDQCKDRLDQIGDLLKEKQKYMSENEKLYNKNQTLSEKIRELKQINDGLKPKERSSQLKIENQKLKEDHDRIAKQAQEIRSQRDKIIAENEKLQKELSRLKNENNKLKKSSQGDFSQGDQVEQSSSSMKKRSPVPTSAKNGAKPRSSSVMPKETAKFQKKYPVSNKQENDSAKRNMQDTSNVKTRDINEEQQYNMEVDKDRIIDLQTQIQVLTHQLKEKMDTIEKLNAQNSEEKENYDKLRTENTDLNNKYNKYIDETNLCNATIIRQKNNLDDKEKEINALQLKTSKIKKLIKIVANIKNTNIVLNERNKELLQKLSDISNPNSNSNINYNNNSQTISYSKMDSLVNDLNKE